MAILCISVVLTILIVFGIYNLVLCNKINNELEKITFVDTITIELDNQKHEYKPQDFIKENGYVEDDELGALVVEYVDLDDVVYEVEANDVKNEDINLIAYFQNYPNTTKEYSVIVTIADTTAPIFTEKVDTINITEGDELDIASKFKAEDASGEVEIKVEGEVDNNKVGTQTVKVLATDKNGNVIEQEVKVVVAEKVEVVEPTTSNTTTTKKETTTSKKSNTNSSSTSTTKKSDSSSSSSSSNKGSSGSNSSSTTTTTTTEAYWCDEGGTHHSIEKGIGWYTSYKQAQQAALDYSDALSCNFEVQECDYCGLFTAYVRDNV